MTDYSVAAIREWMITRLAEELGVEVEAIDPHASFASYGLASRHMLALTVDK